MANSLTSMAVHTLLGVALLVTGCAGPKVHQYGPVLYSAAASEGANAPWQVWIQEADTEGAHAAFARRAEQGATDALTQFGYAESAHMSARYAVAIQGYADLLAAHPDLVIDGR